MQEEEEQAPPIGSLEAVVEEQAAAEGAARQARVQPLSYYAHLHSLRLLCTQSIPAADGSVDTALLLMHAYKGSHHSESVIDNCKLMCMWQTIWRWGAPQGSILCNGPN